MAKIKMDKIKNSKAIKPKRNYLVILMVLLTIAAASTGIFFGLSRLFQTETYYVLKTNVAPRTKITTGMLVAQTTSKGTAPKNALDITQVQSGKVFSKYALEQGDVLSRSNAGSPTDGFTDINDKWVVTSFNMKSGDAVDGRIQKGTFFDVIGIDGDGKARYVFTDVEAVQVDGAASSDDKQVSSAYQITVAMPRSEAARLHSAIAQYKSIKLVISPRDSKFAREASREEEADYGQIEDDKSYDAKNDKDHSDILKNDTKKKQKQVENMNPDKEKKDSDEKEDK